MKDTTKLTAILNSIPWHDQIKSPSRKMELVADRHAFCHFANQIGYSNTEIAKVINRDNSTVSLAIKNFKYKIKLKDDIVLSAIIKLDNYIELKI